MGLMGEMGELRDMGETHSHLPPLSSSSPTKGEVRRGGRNCARRPRRVGRVPEGRERSVNLQLATFNPQLSFSIFNFQFSIFNSKYGIVPCGVHKDAHCFGEGFVVVGVGDLHLRPLTKEFACQQCLEIPAE